MRTNPRNLVALLLLLLFGGCDEKETQPCPLESNLILPDDVDLGPGIDRETATKLFRFAISQLTEEEQDLQVIGVAPHVLEDPKVPFLKGCQQVEVNFARARDIEISGQIRIDEKGNDIVGSNLVRSSQEYWSWIFALKEGRWYFDSTARTIF